MLEFVIFGVLLEGRHRNAIVKLSAERVHCIIHNNDVFERDILENGQIFNVHIVSRLNARVSVIPMLN